MKHIFITLLNTIIVVGWSQSSYSKSVDSSDVPEAKTWAETFRSGSGSKAIMPLRVLLLEQNFTTNGGVKGAEDAKDEDSEVNPLPVKHVFKPLVFSYETCQQVSFFVCVNGVEAQYALKINKMPDKLDDKTVYKMTQASTVVFAEGSATHVLATGMQASKKIADSNLLTKDVNIRGLFEKVLSGMGFDGVILDVKDDYLLVGTVDSRLAAPDLQALVLKDSSDRVAVSEGGSKRGSALLALVNQYNGYGVFKILAKSKGKTPKVGQKVIIAKSKSGAKSNSTSKSKAKSKGEEDSSSDAESEE